MSSKVMVSAATSWYGVIEHFFVNNNGIKVNKENYCRHLRKELFPAIEKVSKRHDWISAQDEAPSYRSDLVQYFLKTKLKPNKTKFYEEGNLCKQIYSIL